MVLIKLGVKSFISEEIDVKFLSETHFSKKPPCPDGFTWGQSNFAIKACLAEWKDYTRKGQMAKNMQPQHAHIANQRGSWGVGRFYFDIETEDGRYFRMYYDRSPKNAVDRKGEWILLAELSPGQD